LVAAFNLWLVTARSCASKIRFLTSPVVQLSKIFHSFSPMNPPLFAPFKKYFDFSFDSFHSVAHSRSMQENLLTAVADSAATSLPVDVAVSFVNVDAAIAFLRSRFVDVDWDTFPNRVTIFGDDQRIEGDEYAGLWVLNLVFAPAPARFGDVNAI
jgi:hypothetical protein